MHNRVWVSTSTKEPIDMLKVVSDHEVKRLVERIAYRQIHLVLDKIAERVRQSLAGREDECSHRVLMCVRELESAARCFELSFELKTGRSSPRSEI